MKGDPTSTEEELGLQQIPIGVETSFPRQEDQAPLKLQPSVHVSRRCQIVFYTAPQSNLHCKKSRQTVVKHCEWPIPFSFTIEISRDTAFSSQLNQYLRSELATTITQSSNDNGLRFYFRLRFRLMAFAAAREWRRFGIENTNEPSTSRQTALDLKCDSGPD